MFHRSARGLLGATALGLLALAVPACDGKRTSATVGGSPAAATPPKGPLADWDGVAAALILTGQQDGYLEPCGCSEGQKGGMARRLDLLKKLEARGWPLVRLDLGSLIHDPADARGGAEEERIKLGIALKALNVMKYDAVALSADDLKVGIDKAIGEYLNVGERPKVVAANVVPASGLESVVARAVRVKAGPIRVGVTAVLDPAAFAALNDPNKEMLAVKGADEALKATLKDLENDTDFQVLLVQEAPPATLDLPGRAPKKAAALAKAFPGFDVVVATSDVPDPEREPSWVNGGKTMLVQVGRKGQYVGVVGLGADRKAKPRYRLVELDLSYDKKTEPLRALVDEDFQALLKEAGVVEDFPKHAFVDGAPGSTFVGALACKECHEKTYFKWVSTKHARAFDALTADRRRDRRFDAECIACHATGLEYTTGYRSEALTPYLKGNQCENCHGPGSKHSAAPDDASFRKAVALTPERAERTTCLKCHDADNSPHFKFPEYFDKIRHKGLDTYDDPKVHKGIDPKAFAKP
ncbi:MAG TPA: multiheme c-type cytochrome [Isosphaeraceae bacterium]|jgi:hypothetical protein|nr:multiheme c-type cytochrome [Isosphaeraceae bacterium]